MRITSVFIGVLGYTRVDPMRHALLTEQWFPGIGGSIQAGAKGDSAGQAAGQATGSALSYTLTKNGLKVGIAAEGSKFWKDEDLN